MNIEFNPNRITGPAAGQPVAKSDAPAPQQDTASLGKADELKSAINNIPLVRPEKVAAAREAISDAKYPPDSMLRAISALIAEKLK